MLNHIIRRGLSNSKDFYKKNATFEITTVLGGGGLLAFMIYFDDKLERRFSLLDNKLTDLAVQVAKIEVRTEKIENQFERKKWW